MSTLSAALLVLALPAAADPSVASKLASPPSALGAAAATDVDDADERSVYTKQGALGSTRLTPCVGFGLPDGIRFSASVKLGGIVSIGGAFATLPRLTIPTTDATLARNAGEGFVRLHPFRGAFFVGLAGGYASTNGTYTEVVRGQTVALTGTTGTGYVAPHLGVQFVLPFSMTIGFDAGVQIPIATRRTGDLAEVLEIVTTKPIPVIHLLELGFAI